MKQAQHKLIRTALCVCCCCNLPNIAAGQVTGATAGANLDNTPGKVWVPAGEFTVDWDGPEARFDEKPMHSVRNHGFWIDATEVTIAQFREFTEDKGYLTTAERTDAWEKLKNQVSAGTLKPSADVLQPGALVFTPPELSVGLRDSSQRGTWTHGANWQHPDGPGSSIEGNDDQPVVHVFWEDAFTYAKWAGTDWSRTPDTSMSNAGYQYQLTSRLQVVATNDVSSLRPQCEKGNLQKQ